MTARSTSIIVACMCCAAIAPSTSPAQTAAPGDILAQARQMAEQGNAQGALPEFDRALALYRKQHDRGGEAQVLNAIGNAYEDLGNFTRALDYLQRALAVKQELGDRLEIGKTESNLGLVYWDLANYPQAIAHFESSLAIARETKNQKLEGSVLNNLGLVYDEQGEYSRSLEYYKQALEIQRAIRFDSGEADALGNLGGWHSLLGEYREAIPYYQQALEIDERLKLKPKASLDLGNIALCQTGLGELEEALRTYDRALVLAHEARSRKDEADWHRGKGSVYLALGQFDRARNEYRQALEIYEASGLKRELLESLEDDGNLHELLGDYVTAEKDFRRAMGLARAIGNPRGVTDCLISLGDLAWRRRRYAQAAGLYQEAYKRAKAAGERDAMANSLVALALALGEQGRVQEGLSQAQQGLDLAHDSGATLLEARARYAMGELMRRGKNYEKAVENYSAGLTIAKTVGETDLEWQLSYGKGQALEALDRSDDAIVAYRQAVTVIEGVRNQLQEERFQSGYIEDKYQVYVALVRLLLKQGKAGEAFQYSEKLRARSYLDLLDRSWAPAASPVEADLRARIRKLESALEHEEARPEPEPKRQKASAYSRELAAAEQEYQALLDDLRHSQPQYAAARSLDVPTTEQIQAELPDDAALLEYIVGEDGVSIFVLTKKNLQAKTVPVRARDLRAKVELFRDLITKQGNKDWVAPGKSLDRLLIEPLETEGWLKGITRLSLVPHAALHYLPFAALPREENGRLRFLVQDYVVDYLPAASALIYGKEAAVPQGNMFALAPANSRLRYTPQEARSVGAFYPEHSLVLVGRSATKRAFEEQAGGFNIIHLAAHGFFDRTNPVFSGVQLEPAAHDDGRLQVYEILRLRLRTRLVTLSACETALGSGYFSEYPAGDDIVGLTRAFLYAGSSSVMASLWEVNDRSTMLFMQGFYRNLRQGEEAGALRQAQLAMIESHGPFSQPYYWAPFVLVGQHK